MAAILDTVRPGGVITSDLINRIIGMLNQHDALLAASSSGSLSINGVQPLSLRMGDELRVHGSGLASAGLKRVSIEGVDVAPASLTGTDGVLSFLVPPIIGIPDLGQTVTLTVESLAGQADTATFFLLPGVSTTLDADFNFTRTIVTPAGALAANTNFEFTYSIQAFSSRAETYILEPKLMSPSPGWSVAMKAGQTELFIPKSQPTPSTIPVVLIVTTGPAGGASVTLGVRSKNFAGVTGSSPADPVTIGAVPGAPNLDVQFSTPQVLGSVQKYANGSLYIRTDGNVANQKATVNPLNVKLKTGGIYTIGTPIISNASWTVTILNNPLTLDTTGTTDAIRPLMFTVNGASGAADADIEIPVTGADALPDNSFRFKAKLRSDPSNPNPA
jgi:hypothetical protein